MCQSLIKHRALSMSDIAEVCTLLPLYAPTQGVILHAGHCHSNLIMEATLQHGNFGYQSHVVKEFTREKLVVCFGADSACITTPFLEKISSFFMLSL